MRRIMSQLLSNGDVVIEGEAQGADTMARQIAYGMQLAVHAWPAQWYKYGRAAGPIRNGQMLAESPDLVLAFHDNIGSSKGTKDMIARAKKAGVPVRLFTSKGEVTEA